MASSPKQPKPTAEEKYLQRRQTEELTKLDEQANARIKRLKRNAYGGPMSGTDAQASARRSTPADDKLGVNTSGRGLGGMVASARLGIVNAEAAQASRERASGQPATAGASPVSRPTRFRGKVARA